MHDSMLTNLLDTDTSGLKLSIYQPTHPASSGRAIQEDTIRFKNALKVIRAHDLYDNEMLADTMNLLDELLDNTEFWKHRTVGLAIFADEHGYETESLAYDVTEAQYVGSQYCAHPLVFEQSLGSNYYILDINHKRPRLIEGTTMACSELVIDDMPDSFDSMTENVEYDKELQHQSGGVGTFHGHSDEAAVQDNVMHYYRKIAQTVSAYLAGYGEPLVLMGVENRVGEVRQLLSYPHVLHEYIEGNGEAMNDQALHDVSMPVIEKYNKKQRSDALVLFHTTPPVRTLIGAKDIEAASVEGRLDTVFVPCFRETADTVRGGYNKSIVMQLNSSMRDETVESLIRSVLSTGGTVQAVEIDAFEDERPRALCRF